MKLVIEQSSSEKNFLIKIIRNYTMRDDITDDSWQYESVSLPQLKNYLVESLLNQNCQWWKCNDVIHPVWQFTRIRRTNRCKCSREIEDAQDLGLKKSGGEGKITIDHLKGKVEEIHYSDKTWSKTERKRVSDFTQQIKFALRTGKKNQQNLKCLE